MSVSTSRNIFLILVRPFELLSSFFFFFHISWLFRLCCSSSSLDALSSRSRRRRCDEQLAYYGFLFFVFHAVECSYCIQIVTLFFSHFFLLLLYLRYYYRVRVYEYTERRITEHRGRGLTMRFCFKVAPTIHVYIVVFTFIVYYSV